jgi:hypothetical protein
MSILNYHPMMGDLRTANTKILEKTKLGKWLSDAGDGEFEIKSGWLEGQVREAIEHGRDEGLKIGIAIQKNKDKIIRVQLTKKKDAVRIFFADQTQQVVMFKEE